MGMWQSLAGTVRVEITSAAPADALTAVNSYGIPLYDVTYQSDLAVSASVARIDYRKLSWLVSSRGDSLKITKRSGLYWLGKGLLKRPLLLLGMVIYLFLSLYLPTRVLFIRVEGNQNISKQSILETAEQCGIRFGASRREVRSEKVKNKLLALIPELQWAGVNTAGCVAVISVNERSMADQKEPISGVSSIVAVRDGIIRECTVTKGNPLCKVGQAVKAGEILVSGYTDCGISIKVTQAEADILAQTQHILTAMTPTNVSARTQIREENTRYSIVFGKKLINFYNDSGISDATCVKMYDIAYLTLPGGFELPVALVKERLIYYNFKDVSLTDDESFDWMEDFSKSYIQQQMIAGQILQEQASMELDNGICRLRSQYQCLEMIGRIQHEGIIQNNGKNN